MRRTLSELKNAATLTQQEADFVKLVGNHDLTYSYSDDGRVWRAGQASYDRIRKMAETLDRAFAVEVWNAMVDTRVVESARPQFYWS